jgi:hypothetical protein
MSRYNTNFESTLEKIARIMSRNYNIDVKLEGNMAMTDGSTIYLPMLEDVSDELRSDLEAFLDHEVAHVKFTDFDELKKPKRVMNRFHKELFNAVEDSRIEIELPKEYSGSAFNLDRLNQKWGAKMNADRPNMPWPIRLIICIREIYDNKVPKTDPQIEPILTAIYPQCVELRKCKNTKEILDATAQLIIDINLAREALSKGLPPIEDVDHEEMMKQMRGESSVELDPDRKKKKGKKAQGNEQFDPATEMQESGEKGDDSDSEEGESGDEQEGEGDSQSQQGEGKSGQGQGQSGGESGESQGTESGESGDTSEEGEGETSDSGDGAEGSDSESDSESAEGEGEQEGNSESADGDAEGESEGESEGKSEGKDSESATGDESDADGDEDGDSDADGKKAEVTNPVEDARNENIHTHESTTGEEGDRSRNKKSTAKPQTESEFDNKAPLETRKNYAKGWAESATEKQMMEDSAEKKGSEFDKHVFSSESYMEIQLEKAIQSEPSVKQVYGMYHGREKDINDKNISLPYSREYDEVIDYTGRVTAAERVEYASRKKRVMKQINPIKTHLERVLKVKENARMRPEQERGLLNNRSLAQMCINKNYRTPFKINTKEDTTNVAVSLVIDCSGSMHGEQIEMARQTALALGEALKAIGIAFEAVGFNTSSNYELASKVGSLSAKEVARFNRFGETLRLMIFKKFDSNDLSGVVKAEAGGANADGESIVWAAKRLALRQEKRKIMIVLSDGQPSYSGANHEVLAGDLKRVIKMLPKAGIEPIGVGIQTDDPKLFYPDWVMVNDLNELSRTVMSKLAKMLEANIKKFNH